MSNEIKMMPEFSGEEEAVKSAETTKEVVVQETETPAEPPAEEVETPEQKPVEAEPNEPVLDDDTTRLEKAVQGLQEERAKLLREVQELRGQKREIKKEEIIKVEEKIEDLTDINPEDVKLVDKILRSKGYITKAEASKMSYESVKTQKLNEFLDKYPEYKPENDTNDINWNTLQRELALYRLPEDPLKVGELLERAHKAISKPVSGQALAAKKQQLKTAGVGGGGVQRPSSRKTLTVEKRGMLLQGGWSEEEIKQMESKL